MDTLHPHFPSPLGNRQVHQNKIHLCSLQAQNKQRWLTSLGDELGGPEQQHPTSQQESMLDIQPWEANATRTMGLFAVRVFLTPW